MEYTPGPVRVPTNGEDFSSEACAKELEALQGLSHEQRITERTEWKFEGDTILVETINDIEGFYQRLVVNGVPGEWTYLNSNTTHHPEGYIVFHQFWDGEVTVDVPLKLLPAEPCQ